MFERFSPIVAKCQNGLVNYKYLSLCNAAENAVKCLPSHTHTHTQKTYLKERIQFGIVPKNLLFALIRLALKIEMD